MDEFRVIRLAGEWDESQRPGLCRHIASSFGDDWTLAAVIPSQSAAVAVPGPAPAWVAGEDFPTRPGLAIAKAAEQAEQSLPTLGVDQHVVAANDHPTTPSVTVAILDPEMVRLRHRVAQYLGCPPWELELRPTWNVDGQLVAVDMVRFPYKGPAAKRVDLLTDLAQTVVGTADWRVQDDPAAGTARLELWDDPLAKPIMWPLTPGDPTGISVDSVPIGVDDNGDVVTLGLIERHTLVGGVPGSGKSGWASAWLGAVACLDNVALVGIDPKRVEMGLVRDRLSTVATTVESAVEVLREVFDEAEARYEALAALGRKKVTPDLLDKFPLIVVVIDELAELTAWADGGTKEEKALEAEARGLIRRLIQKARAAGICVVSMTQKPMANVVPTAIRDNMQLRIGFATTTDAMTDTILGEGAHDLALCTEIPTSKRGLGYVLDEVVRRPVRFRTWWLPEAGDGGAPAGSTTVEQVIDATKHLRVDLPWLGRGPLDEREIQARAAELVARVTGEPVVEEVGSVDFSDLDFDDDTEPAHESPRTHNSEEDVLDREEDPWA